jgi:peptidoglycan-associated lipoprotein
MKNRALMTIVLASLFLTLSCVSKKKQDGAAGAGPAAGDVAGMPDASVSGKEMTFDSTGSDSGNIQGLSTVYFDYDQSNLSADARRQLAENADWIKKNGQVAVQIEGHCDGRGTVEYNIALGERRALSVKTYLTGLGVESKRLSVISYGKERPVAQGDNDAAYAKNRRANFVPVPK